MPLNLQLDHAQNTPGQSQHLTWNLRVPPIGTFPHAA